MKNWTIKWWLPLLMVGFLLSCGSSQVAEEDVLSEDSWEATENEGSEEDMESAENADSEGSEEEMLSDAEDAIEDAEASWEEDSEAAEQSVAEAEQEANEALGEDMGSLSVAENTQESSDMDTPSFDSMESEAGTQLAKNVAPSVNPEIPTEAVSKEGTNLNRYYFVRKGDSPVSVSTLLYGNGDKAESLVSWNGGNWKSGQVIYYTSADTPDDSKMTSFYSERNVQSEQYTVQKGDWLSKIAKERFGNFKSWKEISVSNEVSNPDLIYPGQVLALYPQDLSPWGRADESLADSGAGTPPVATNTPSPSEGSAESFDEQEMLIPPEVKSEPAVTNKDQKPVKEMRAIGTTKAEKPQQASSEVGGFFQRNWLIGSMIGIGALIGLFIWFVAFRPSDENHQI